MKNNRYIQRIDRMVKKVLFWIGEIIGLIFLAFVMIHFCFQTVKIHGASMQPSYQDGDLVLVNKLEYHINDPKRMDTVVLELENGTSIHYSVKRVIGLPGETVEIKDGKIYINGDILKYTYEDNILSAGKAAYGITLEEDEYFVLGDNCNNSEDSRANNIGNIDREQFVGKVVGTLHGSK